MTLQVCSSDLGSGERGNYFSIPSREKPLVRSALYVRISRWGLCRPLMGGQCQAGLRREGAFSTCPLESHADWPMTMPLIRNSHSCQSHVFYCDIHVHVCTKEYSTTFVYIQQKEENCNNDKSDSSTCPIY